MQSGRLREARHNPCRGLGVAAMDSQGGGQNPLKPIDMNLHTLDWHGSRPADTGPEGPWMVPASERRQKNFSADSTPHSTPEAAGAVILNLLEITRDGQEGFQHAAQHVGDRGLRDEFHKFARERRSMVSELRAVLKTLGQPAPEPRGTVGAALFRAWTDIRTVVAKRDDQAILDEAKRGEATAVAAYLTALNDTPPLPDMVYDAIRALLEKVQRAHDRMQSLCDSGYYHRPPFR